ncbi:hypothetical protein FOZ60_012883 [Perkinsus olseni]|uniref:Uncharacterized protein n=1 Tax=Perkinsus olseni TaxID=32597 RepID=A0A7J6NAA3_PEROL|nr:hypothetical protein FOZ60_012883 [Perkinsus olseni]
MRTTAQVLSFYILGCSAVEAITSNRNHLQFYKEIRYPWYNKEWPSCSKRTLCPSSSNYTWNYTFGQLLGSRVKNFVFGGYAIGQNAEIERDWPRDRDWPEDEFKDLKAHVESLGGKILLNLGRYIADTFNKTAFGHSVKNFTDRYPVDGFQVRMVFEGSERRRHDPKHAKEILEVTKEAGEEAALWFSAKDWQKIKEAGLGEVADVNLVSLWPSCNESYPKFNTNQFAEKVINNATSAGVDPGSLVIEIPLFVANSCEVEDVGYSDAILDYGAPPTGNGSILYDHGYRIHPRYFFSQTRAVEKVDLAREYGLHGILLHGGDGWTQDLYPWDDNSLINALSKKF